MVSSCRVRTWSVMNRGRWRSSNRVTAAPRARRRPKAPRPSGRRASCPSARSCRKPWSGCDAQFFAQPVNREQASLDGSRIVAGFEQQNVCPALHQALRLDIIGLDQLLET